jgi:succinate dehydrogenase/fumarate reductase flavoprotein subunit
MNSMVFLKGYQWPFDARKTIGGSSLVDILVYIETVVRGRRVYLDFRRNPTGFDFATLRDEARDYLTRSKALHDTPIARLLHMNPAAVELYKAHDMDITREPLEVAVCAQHNNGGLAGNLWWESLNLKHLFPVGEINGSHGVYRPGGSALNSGQVAGFRASDYIAARYRGWTLDAKSFRAAAQEALADVAGWLDRAAAAKRTWKEERAEFQARMSAAGAHIRAAARLATAVDEAWAQVRRLEREGTRSESARDRIESLRNRQLCLAHAVYLEAIRFAIGSGVGSRGSAIVVDPNGQPVHPRLSADWRILPEDPAFRERVLETEVRADRTVISRWVPRRPLPACDAWFETAWAAYRNGEIYG